MALQVWLPFNGNLNNQGLSRITVTNYGATVTDDGKIGKAYAFTNSQYMELSNMPFSSLTTCSVCFWLKLNSSETDWLPFTGQTGSYYILATRSGTGNFYHQNAGSPSKIYVDGIERLNPIRDGKWHHYCIINVNFSSWTKFYINYYGSTGSGWNWTGTMNDLRIYNHNLSIKEVKEISKGLVLHYKLDSLDSSTNLINGLVAGGQTSISGNTINVSGSNSDTYFFIKISRAMTSGKTYKISCIGNFASGIYYNFPIAGQSNTSPGLFKIQNGYCEMIFIANNACQNAGTQIILDDNGRNAGVGSIINIKLEEVNIIYDCSGYLNNGTIVGSLYLNNDSPKYNHSTIFGSGQHIYNASNGIPGSSGSTLTVSCWFYQTDRTGYQGLVGNRGAQGSISSHTPLNWYLYTHTNDGSIQFHGSGQNKSSIIPNLNMWHHVVAVVKNTNRYDLYLDGHKVISDMSYTWGSTTQRIVVSGYGANGENFKGRLSDIRIYVTALTEDDILELYHTAGSIDNQGNLLVREFNELETNILFNENYGIMVKQWLGGLSSYTQSNCSCTLTDTGYRIYRGPNLTVTNNGNTMWGGFVIDNSGNRFNLTKGHTYIIEFYVKGQSSNAVGDIYWTNQVGWGGGGLNPNPSNVTMNNPVGSNFQSSEWKYFYYKFTINDDIYKVCTSTYSSFTQGNTYLSYKGFKFGFGYTSTGSLGTDLYIKNLSMYDITTNTNININKRGIMNANKFSENGNITRYFNNKTIESTQFLEI